MKKDVDLETIEFYRNSSDWAIVVDLSEVCESISADPVMKSVLSCMDLSEFMQLLIVDIRRYDADDVLSVIYDKMDYSLSEQELNHLDRYIDSLKETVENTIYHHLPVDRKYEHFSLHRWIQSDEVVVGSVKKVYRLYEPEHWSTKV